MILLLGGNECRLSLVVLWLSLALNLIDLSSPFSHESSHLESVKVTVNFVQPSNNYIRAFQSKIKCFREQETLQLELQFVTNSNKNTRNGRTGRKHLFGSEVVTLNLQYDKTVPRYRVFRTKRNKANIPITKSFTEKLLYKRETCLPKQFQSISEFYGTIDGESRNLTFVRAIVQFVDCNKVFLFAFVRRQNALYQIRPSLLNLELQNGQIDIDQTVDSMADENVHEIFTILHDIDSNVFSENSMAIQNAIKFDLEFVKDKRYDKMLGNLYEKKKSLIEDGLCFIHVLADNKFFNRMNNDFYQVVIYMKTILMLANEIVKNTNWPEEHYNLYGFSLREIDIDMLFSEKLDHFERSQLESILIANSGNDDKIDRSRKDNCLMFLLTGKEILSNGMAMHGLAKTAAIFSTQNDNVGATSIATCKDDPWQFACLLTLSHELGHSLGASNDDDKQSEDYLMTPVNDLQKSVAPNRLKLSASSIQYITKNTFEKFNLLRLFIKATDWSICGNGLMEQGEECDEGQNNLCCNGQCQLRPGAQCSPYNSLCCDDQCKFITNPQKVRLPWNYCDDKQLYCRNKQIFSQSDTISVACGPRITNTGRIINQRDLAGREQTEVSSTSASTTTEIVEEDFDLEPFFRGDAIKVDDKVNDKIKPSENVVKLPTVTATSSKRKARSSTRKPKTKAKQKKKHVASKEDKMRRLWFLLLFVLIVIACLLLREIVLPLVTYMVPIANGVISQWRAFGIYRVQHEQERNNRQVVDERNAVELKAMTELINSQTEKEDQNEMSSESFETSEDEIFLNTRL